MIGCRPCLDGGKRGLASHATKVVSWLRRQALARRCDRLTLTGSVEGAAFSEAAAATTVMSSPSAGRGDG
jgi:hypothetical protein